MGPESGSSAVLDRDQIIPQKKEVVAAPEISKGTEIKKIAAVFGIPNDYEPFKDNEQRDQDRRKAVSRYHELVKPAEKYENSWDKPPITEAEKNAGWKIFWDNMPLKQKAERQKLLLKLRLQGIKDPDKLVHFFEKQFVGSDIAKDLRNDPTKKPEPGFHAREAYRSIHREFKNPEVIATYKKINNPGLATERLAELGGYALIAIHYDHKDYADYRNLLDKIGSIPEAKYQKVVTQLKQHPYLLAQRHDSNHNNSLEGIVALIESGEITKEQQNILNQIDGINQLRKDPNFKPEYTFGPQEKSPQELFESGNLYGNQLTILHQIIFEQAQMTRDGNPPHRLSQDIFKNIAKMNPENSERLANLIKQGWDIGNIHDYIQYGTGNEKLEEVLASAENVIARMDEDGFKECIRLLRSKNTRYQYGRNFMSLGNAQSVNRLFDALTPEQLTKASLVSNLAKAHFETNNIPEDKHKQSYLDHYLRVDETGINPQLFYLREQLKTTDLEKITDPQEKKFWQFLSTIESAPTTNHLPIIYDYLLTNFDKIDLFSKDGKPTFALYYHLTDHLTNMTEQEFSKKGLFINFKYQRYEPLMFLLSPELCPEKFSDLSTYLKDHPQTETALLMNPLSWHTYFKDGVAQEPLIKMLAKTNRSEAIKLLEKEEVIKSMPELSQKFWSKWTELPYDVQIILARQVESIGEISDKVIENMEGTLTILNQIDKSPSKEIHRLKDQLTGLLLTAEDPLKAFNRIKQVFERNNLPTFGKIFSVFEILYSPQVLEQSITQAGHRADLSPVLVNAKVGSHQLRRYGIIYHDLLKVHIESANPSLHSFIKTFQDGKQLYDEYEQNPDSFEDPTNLIKKHQLQRFFDRLDVLFASSLEGKRSNAHVGTEIPLNQRLENVKTNFGVKEDQTISDRVTEMFLKPVGYTSLEQVLHKMDSAKLNAHLRNTEIAQKIIAEGGLAKSMKEGDLVKGVVGEYFDLILQNGSVAREYLGPSAGSDLTPYDTDTSMIMDGDSQSLTGVIENSISKDYGDIMLVIRDRDQFQKTDPENYSFDSTKYELFNSRVHGDRHFGIRTGIPSTEIDALIARDNLTDSPTKLARLFFDISQNGFYIPVVNEKDELIYTPEMFEQYRINNKEVQQTLDDPNFKPADLITALSQTAFIKELYDAPSGVWEGYSLGKHTEMVGTQFEKYFADFSSPLLEKNHMRILLALHDLGKPLAFQDTGATDKQHDYTVKFLPKVLESLDVAPKEAEIITGIVSDDLFGDYIKGSIAPEEAALSLNDKAQKLGVPTNELYQLVTTYYMSDAGSYTADAGGASSLDFLFEFKQTKDGKPVVSFSTDVQTKIDLLTPLLH